MNLRPDDATQPTDLTGQRVGHYVVEARIGAGGMGQVYRARDTREMLERPVALKVLSAELQGNEIARRRFLREIKLGSHVNHPYLTTVYDAVVHQDRVVLVMEYIDGQPLSSLLRAREGTLEQRMRWLREIAEALEAVHSGNLIHRDVKPANVMITTSGHAKLTDLGLAKTVPAPPQGESTATAATPLTGAGAGPGTPSYMSPEQIRQTQVGFRTDVFSFGILMYEMLYGKHPFARGTALETVSAILHEPSSGGTLDADLREPALVDRFLQRCLAKDPQERYADGAELVRGLDALVDSSAHSSPTKLRVWKSVAGAVVLAAVLAGSLGVWWLSRPLPAASSRIRVAVTPFEDRTGIDGSMVGELIADSVATDLEVSSVIQGLGPDRTRTFSGGGEARRSVTVLAANMIAAFSADYVLTGTVYRHDDGYLVNCAYVGAPEGAPLPAAFRVRARDAVAAAEKIASKVRRNLPEIGILMAIRDDRIDIGQVLSSDSEAALAYRRGMVAWIEERLVESVGEFRAALEIDPGFVLARARLAEALFHLGYHKDARTEIGQLRLGVARGVAERRMFLEVDAVEALVLGRREAELEATAALVAGWADDADVLRRHSQALASNQRYDEALLVLDSARSTEPGNAKILLARIDLLRRLGRYGEALLAVEAATPAFRDPFNPEGLGALDVARAEIHWYEGDYDGARSAYLSAVRHLGEAGRQISRSEALFELAKLDVDQGSLDAADAPLAEALDLAAATGNLGMRSDALLTRGVQKAKRADWDGAIEDLRESADLGRRLGNPALMAASMGNLVSILAYLGRRDEAKPLLAECLQLATELGRIDIQRQMTMSLSEIQYANGEVGEAVDLLTRLAEEFDDDLPERVGARALLELAQLARSLGRYATALPAADRAVAAFERLGVDEDVVRSRSTRAELRAELGMREEAEVDLERSRQLCNAAEGGSLVDVCELQSGAEVWVMAMLPGGARCIDALSRVGGTGDRFRCRCFAATGDLASAVEACRSVVDTEGTSPSIRLEARTILAGAYRREGHTERSETLAAEILKEAGTMGLLLEMVRAGQLLPGRPDPQIKDAVLTLRRELRTLGVPPDRIDPTLRDAVTALEEEKS